MPGHLLSPLLPFTSLGWLYLNLTFTNFVPVGTQRRSTTFDETLHHGTPHVFVSIAVDLLEKLVDRRIPTSVRIVVTCELFVVSKDFIGDPIPILVERLITG